MLNSGSLKNLAGDEGMSFDKKDRNKRREKNKYGEGFNSKDVKFSSPEQRKRTNNWKDFLNFTPENYDDEDE